VVVIQLVWDTRFAPHAMGVHMDIRHAGSFERLPAETQSPLAMAVSRTAAASGFSTADVRQAESRLKSIDSANALLMAHSLHPQHHPLQARSPSSALDHLLVPLPDFTWKRGVFVSAYLYTTWQYFFYELVRDNQTLLVTSQVSTDGVVLVHALLCNTMH